MDVIDAIHGRRSIRAYRHDPISRALIAELLWAAVQAPTPPVSGDAPWALCVVEGVDRLAALGARALQYAREHQPQDRPWRWTESPGFTVFWGAPVLVLICAQAGNPEAPFDCCRAGQNLMLAAHAKGLGSCWVGAPMPWLHSAGVAAELGLPRGYEVVVAVVLGHAAESPAGNPRPQPHIVWSES